MKTGKEKNTKYKSFQSLPGALKNKINEIDGFHKKIDGYKKIWGILDEITMEGLKRSERQKHDIERLKNDPDKYTEWLLKNLERLKHINEVRQNELMVFETNLKKLIKYFEKEKKILKAVKKDNRRDNQKDNQRNNQKDNHQRRKKENDLLALAQLYFENGEFSLLGNVCTEFEQTCRRTCRETCRETCRKTCREIC